MSRLFTEDFLRSVSRMRIIARQVPGGGRRAEHRSRDLGSGMEFRDFRVYSPGDDLRRVDWSLYRRSGHLFLRLFEEPEDLPVYILPDVSDSMFFEAPPRADAARLIAGVIAAVSMNQHDRVSVHPFGADLAAPLAPGLGRGGLKRACAYLERLRPAGATNLSRSLRRFGGLPLRAGLAVVISDFFDPRGVDAVIGALRLLRHRLLLVQVVRASDANPTVSGEVTLVDCESGAAVDVTVGASTLQRYRQAHDSFCEELRRFAARRRAAHVQLDADRPVLTQLGDVFRNGVLVT